MADFAAILCKPIPAGAVINVSTNLPALLRLEDLSDDNTVAQDPVGDSPETWMGIPRIDAEVQLVA